MERTHRHSTWAAATASPTASAGSLKDGSPRHLEARSARRIPLGHRFLLGFGLLILLCQGCQPVDLPNEALNASWNQESAAPPIKVLLVDGQNNHASWPKTSEMMRKYLLETGLFTVDLARTAPKGTDEDFAPDFAAYDVVLSNYNGAPWPEKTQQDFEAFVSGGGGLVIVHAADNAFPEWPAYNRMIGLGGWGNRNEASGPYLYYNDENQSVRDDQPGGGGSHGPQHQFQVTTRAADHPIMKGLPKVWLHAQDELYDRLRGPAENIEVLATAFSAADKNGTNRHEPMVMTVTFEKGRVFHTTLGHDTYSQECVGFITLLQRGTEWAATGNVTQDVPEDFPTADQSISREPKAPPKPELPIVPDSLGTTNNVTRRGPIYFAGQFSPEDLEIIKQQGIKTIVSLRQTSEINWDEAEAARDAGLEFHQFSCRKPSELGAETLGELYDLLDQANDGEKVLVHCGGAARVGAVWALYRVQKQGIDAEQAILEGEAIGMPRGLKSDVKAVLDQQK